MDIIVGIFVAVALFFLGSITQAWKKLVGILTKAFCKIFPALDKKRAQAKKIKVSEQLKETYNVDEVRKENIGMQKIKVVRVGYIILTIIAGILIVANLEKLSGRIISNWLADVLNSIGIKISYINMNTTYTAVLFSVFSFGATSTLNSWKATKEYRKQRKKEKLIKKALNNMTSAELAEEVEKKNEQEKKVELNNKNKIM